MKRTSSRPVVLLLSDGRPNRVPPGADGRPESTILAITDRLRSAGVRVITVGLGRSGDLDEALLRRMAGGSGDYRYALTGEALLAAFREVGSIIECP